MGRLPKRILFYRGSGFYSRQVQDPTNIFLTDGVSEGEFKAIIDEELRRIRSMSYFPVFSCSQPPTSYLTTGACDELDFKPKITLIVVGKKHKVVFFPTSRADADRSGNCPAGTVVDTGVVSPVEFDYYLYGHAGLLGTSKPAHYNVLLDENEFTYVIPSRSHTRW